MGNKSSINVLPLEDFEFLPCSAWFTEINGNSRPAEEEYWHFVVPDLWCNGNAGGQWGQIFTLYSAQMRQRLQLGVKYYQIIYWILLGWREYLLFFPEKNIDFKDGFGIN